MPDETSVCALGVSVHPRTSPSIARMARVASYITMGEWRVSVSYTDEPCTMTDHVITGKTDARGIFEYLMAMFTPDDDEIVVMVLDPSYVVVYTHQAFVRHYPSHDLTTRRWVPAATHT